MSTEDAPKPVAEIHGGLLRWHIPAPDFSVAQKYMCGVHLLFDQATIDAAVAKEHSEELRICALRALIAWDGTVLPKARDGLMQERMEDLRAALAGLGA